MSERIKTGFMVLLLLGLCIALADGFVDALNIPYGGTEADRILLDRLISRL